MASVNDVPRDANEMFRQMNRRLISLERRRTGDGVLIDGNCEYGGGSGGDTSYYGGGTDYPDGHYPDGGWAGGGATYTAGANIAIVGSVINFEVVFEEPVSPRVGMFWFDEGA